MRDKKNWAKTKVVCTLGPASQSVGCLEKLIHAGMDVARLNFSHGSLEEHLTAIQNTRDAGKRTGENVSIMQDLCGPKIRTGKLRDGKIELKEGALFTFTIDEVEGDVHRVSTTYRELPMDVKEGDSILLNDGAIKLQVVSKTKNRCPVQSRLWRRAH